MLTFSKLKPLTRQATPLIRLLTTSAIKTHVENGITVTSTDTYTTFEFSKPKKTYSFHNAFLRDSSEGALSIEQGSGQKLFTTASIIGQAPVEIEIPNEQTVRILWPDKEVSEYDLNFFNKHSSIKSRKKGRYFDDEVSIWDGLHKESEGKFPIVSKIEHDYNDYLTKNETLKDVLEDLNKFGLSIIKNIPSQSQEAFDSSNDVPIVQKLGERIGYIKQTFYGTTFDVRSKPNATNIADTDKFLPLHQDLLYYESPPGLQLLHFLKNQATGGENVFSDGFAAARYVKERDTDAYLALLEVPINYHYNRDGNRYFKSRPLVVENNGIADSLIYKEKDYFKEVNYSPPFQGPFDFGITTHLNDPTFESNAKDLGDRHIFEDFLRGLKMFEDFINDPINKIKFKTEEGTCVIFDNRRVLHARDAFDANSGERWLQGTYLDRDTFLSKLRVVKNIEA